MDNTYQKVHESCICREYAAHILLGYIRDSAFKQGIDSIIKDTMDAWAKMMLDRSGVDVPETKEKL